MSLRLQILLLLVSASLLGCGEERVCPFPKSASAPEAADRVQKEAVAQAEKPGGDARPVGGNAAADPGAAKPTPRKIIYTGNVDLVVDDFDKAEQQLRELIEEHESYLANSQI